MSKYQLKAQELVDKFRQFADGTDSETDRYSPGVEKEKAKQCALIAVDELIANEHLEAGDASFWKPVKEELLKK